MDAAGNDGDGQMPDSWSRFVKAVLKKDYAIGYLLLAVLGRSTLVLGTLLGNLTGVGSKPKVKRVQFLSCRMTVRQRMTPQACVAAPMVHFKLHQQLADDTMQGRDTTTPVPVAQLHDKQDRQDGQPQAAASGSQLEQVLPADPEPELLDNTSAVAALLMTLGMPKSDVQDILTHNELPQDQVRPACICITTHSHTSWALLRPLLWTCTLWIPR